jgi:hypothetical protein
MKKSIIIALVVLVFPVNLALAGPTQTPALEPNTATASLHPYELSLPGMVIDETTDKLQERIEAEFHLQLQARLVHIEQELMKVFERGSEDTRLSDNTIVIPTAQGS